MSRYAGGLSKPDAPAYGRYPVAGGGGPRDAGQCSTSISQVLYSDGGFSLQDTTFSRPTTLFLPAVVDRRGYRLLDLFLVERTIARLCSNDKGSSLPNAIGTA